MTEKNDSKGSSLFRNKVKASTSKIIGLLSSQNNVGKDKKTTKNLSVNLNKDVAGKEKTKGFKKANFQPAKLDKLKNNIDQIPQPVLSQHRLKSAKKNMQTDTFTSYIAHPQQAIVISEAKPQQAVIISEPTKGQARRAPLSASIVEASKPPQLRSIEEDRALKAKKNVQTDTSTSYIAHPQQTIVINEVKPQQAVIISEPKGENITQASADISANFDEFDKMIDVSESQRSASKSKQSDSISRTQLHSKKFYESMYESLPTAEKEGTTKNAFLQKALNYQVDKIVKNMQRNSSKSSNQVSSDEVPKSQANGLNTEPKNKGFTR